MVNEHTVDCHPSPSELPSRTQPLIFLWTPKGVYLSWIFLRAFLKPVYPTVVAKKFQIYGVKITGKYICDTKSWICSFLPISPNKTSPYVLISTPKAKGNYPFSLNRIFWKSFFLPAEGGKDYGAEKITKIKLVRVLVTSIYKFHHLCSLYIFGFHFAVP